MSKFLSLLLAAVLVSPTIAAVPAKAEGLQQVVAGDTLSAGGKHSCVLTVSGAVRCWGSDEWGQATVPSGLGVVKQVSAGLKHSCVLTVAGAVKCWGRKTQNSLAVAAVVPSGLGVVTQVSAGGDHSCALQISGAVRCWGSDEWGQVTVPSGLGVVTQVSAGGNHSCALQISGAVRCWGRHESSPVVVPSDLGVVTQVSAGLKHTCVLIVSGVVRCWGRDVLGPVTVPSDLGVVTQVSAGGGTCVLTVSGDVRCWGIVSSGLVTVPSGLGVVTQVSMGGEHSCLLTQSGDARCRGGSSHLIPFGLGVVIQVSSGGAHSCLLTSSGAVRCWGQNSFGQTTVPADLGVVTQVTAGTSHTCALIVSGTVRCWGQNDRGQTTVPSDLGVVTQVSAGGMHTCALLASGAVRCWGIEIRHSSATAVPADLGVVTQVSAGGRQTCVVTVEGSVRCWGDSYGWYDTIPSNLGPVTQVSAGSTGNCLLASSGAVRCWGNSLWGLTTIPSDVGAFTQVSAGGDHFCVITVSGSAKCLRKFNGAGGANSEIGVIAQVSAGGDHFCVLTASGAVRCWGNDQYKLSQIPTFETAQLPIKQATIKSIQTISGSIDGSVNLGTVAEANFQFSADEAVYYRWFRNGKEIRGANQSSFVVSELDFGTFLTVAISFLEDGNLVQGLSAARYIEVPLIDYQVPAVSGDKSLGSTLRAVVPKQDELISYSYQWLRNGEVIGGSRAETYRITIEDLGANLSVRVTGSKDRYQDTTRNSTSHNISKLGTNSPCKNVTLKPSIRPDAKKQPSIETWSSRQFVGMRLKGNNGTWPAATKFCVFWVANGYQVVSGATSADYQSRSVDSQRTLQYAVVGTHKEGGSYLRTSKPIKLKPCSGLQTGTNTVNSINGIPTRITGYIDSCTEAKSVQYREKPFGKEWSSWQDYPRGRAGNFSITKTFRGFSRYQVRVKNVGNKWRQSSIMSVNVQTRTSRPLTFSSSSFRISQGFTQGGSIRVKFAGDKEFSGKCTLRAQTNYAFNFALTFMGRESKVSSFNVQNGRGSGTISVKYNGHFRVDAICLDPKFTELGTSSLVTFKATF
jgi:alpha-tubulin suppressor-like RCC1 family protein